MKKDQVMHTFHRQRHPVGRPACGLAAFTAVIVGSSFFVWTSTASAQSEDTGGESTTVETSTGGYTTFGKDEVARSELLPEEHQPTRPPTAQELESGDPMELMKRDFALYLGAAESFREDVRDLIEIRYNRERERIAGQYEQKIQVLEREERQRRLEAIARFEEFLRKYPNDEFYSPDAMFRLAELYFERASDDYLARTQNYEQQLAAYERGETSTEPDVPTPNFQKTISLYVDLLTRFPQYRHADAARYLLGYSYEEMEQVEPALAEYNVLVTNHPSSRFLPEVWTRIGEIYFDENKPDSLAKAAPAYSKVLEHRDSPYYDKALYKLAWAYYRMDDYDRAVSGFIGLIDYADEQRKLTGKTGSELRSEAIQYVAISLSDEGWGGMERARSVLTPIDQKEYTAEIWKRYGEILFDQSRYPQSIEVMEITIAKYPNNAQNPIVQAKIITAYERMRDFDGATRAREVLVEKYGDQSEWAKANADDREALGQARELTERSLESAALFHHRQAQAHKKNNDTKNARESYARAAQNYQIFLDRYPDSKNAYDFTFFLAECLYYSDDYLGAAHTYSKVRDSNADNRHLGDASLSAVISYEKEIEKREAAKQLEKVKVLTAAERKDRPLSPQPLPEIRVELIQASDRYLTLLPDHERAPAIAYRAAEIFYHYDQLDEARRRFEAIVVRYPSNEVARYSANLIIESYLAVEDWDNVEKWSQQLMDATAKSQGGSEADIAAQKAFSEQLKDFKVGARFKKAEQLNAAGDFEQAAETYVALVDESPDHEFADKALFNAAIAFEKVKRFDTASKIYQRIYDTYPKSELADRSLFRVGVNYEKGFDFGPAVEAYTKLVERYPNSEHRADALYNVAVTLENQQQYGQAAAAFKRYATTFPRREDAGDVFYRSAEVYEKMKAWPEMISTLNQFIQSYGRDRKQTQRVVEAYKKMGDAQQKQSQGKSAIAAYKNCLKEYKARGLKPQDRAGRFAGQCAFEIAEDLFREYDAVRLVGTGKVQAAALTKKATMQRTVEATYRDVFQYKRAETTLAALYRIGHSYERFAESMYRAEVPPEFKNDQDLADEYRLQLEEKAQVLERKAEQAYRKANEEAVKTKVTNEWTQRILEGLNKYAPEEFPVQKTGKSSLQTFTVSGHAMDSLDRDPRAADPNASGVTAPISSEGDDS